MRPPRRLSVPARSARVLTALAVAIGGLAVARADAAPQPAAPLTVQVLSNRADLVSGGDALVGVTLPTGARPADLRVTVEGRDVTSAFRPTATRLEGIVTGLRRGPNAVTATLRDGRASRLTVTNSDLGGPIFSGPQIQPWYCLEGALDAQCRRPVAYRWLFKNAMTGRFTEFDGKAVPAGAATTTTDDGKTVPYVVRVESGTMLRSQYLIAVLADPTKPVSRTSRPVGWTGKVFVPHGAGCGMGHSEGAAPDVLLDTQLSRGYAVLSTALEHNTENCNVVVQAESVMMAKERLIEQYGDVRFLMGEGCSGGSIAQLHMANAYPGLYDGLTVECTYPDIPVADLLDCPALLRYWNDPRKWEPGVVWTERDMSAATGQASSSVCRSWVDAPVLNFSNMFDPTVGVACDVPDRQPEAVYDPVTNPKGVRCTFQDYLVNILGKRPPAQWGEVEKKTGQGFANRPYDNVGLQYGLRALLARQITPAQFVDLNRKVGAVDIDYGSQPERVAADPTAIAATYRSGVLNEGNNLDLVPIIDSPIIGDRYEIHDNYKSWALRARLDASNGHHDNHVIFYGPNPPDPFRVMDEWLTNLTADKSRLPLDRKVVKHKPAEAADSCELPTRATCDFLLGPAASIRWGAGASLATDVIKCRLKPLLRNDYAPVLFTDAQWEALQKAFPSGVCDFSKPGIAQQPSVAWQTYAGGPGGKPLGAPPMSAPVRG